MYTAFYGLREKPFALSPDPRFLYLAASHREALAHLLYGIEQGEGFISVTGEVGTGKTTLSRTLLERLEGEIEVAFLFNPSRTALELLQSICAEFGLPAEGLQRRNLMAQLNEFLLEKKRQGRRVLLIIDEAQTLSETTLEQVRLLSNLETSREKLIQILLLGQPELDRKLDERGLRQLRQRISVRWQLAPLSPTETHAYVRHRIAVAAGEPKDIFSDAALREVHRRTSGVPRLINQLCDRTLLGGYAARSEKIGPALVRAAAREIPDTRRPRSFTRLGRSERSFRPWLFFVAMCALVGVGLYAGLEVGRSGLADAVASRARSEAVEAGGGPRGGGVAADTRPNTSAVSAGGSVNSSAATSPQPPVAAPPPVIARPIGPVPSDVPEDLFLAARRSTLPTTSLAPGVLVEILANQDPRLALASTERALLSRFDRPAPAASAKTPAELETNLRAAGLETTAFDGGSLTLLRRLNHPVALELYADRAGVEAVEPAGKGAAESRTLPRWVALVGFEPDRVRVVGLLRGREVSVPSDDFERAWSQSQTGILAWQRYESIPDLLAQRARGDSVSWLQNALRELEFHEPMPTGQFDAATTESLKRYQLDRGLLADGIAGPLTLIALFGELDRYPVPRLAPISSSTSEIVPPNPNLNPNAQNRPGSVAGHAPGGVEPTSGGDRG